MMFGQMGISVVFTLLLIFRTLSEAVLDKQHLKKLVHRQGTLLDLG